MSHSEFAAASIKGYIDRVAKKIKAARGIVSTAGSGKVSLKRIGATTAESVPRIVGPRLEINDEVLMVMLEGKPVVIGKLIRASPTSERYDHKLVINGTATDQFLVESAGGTDILVVDTTNGQVIGASFNSPVVDMLAQSTADATSTTSTVTYSVAATLSLTLPAGTWAVKAIGGCGLQHSAGGVVRLAIFIDGVEGTSRTVSALSTGYRTVLDNAAATGIAGGGSINIEVKYRSSDAGTTAANNPFVLAIATRTS